MKAIKIEANQSGKRYALVANDETFGVYAECKNYYRHAPNGIATSWRYCAKGMTREEADKLFARKVAGKAR